MCTLFEDMPMQCLHKVDCIFTKWSTPYSFKIDEMVPFVKNELKFNIFKHLKIQHNRKTKHGKQIWKRNGKQKGKRKIKSQKRKIKIKILKRQAGAELGQAQLKLGLDLTSTSLH